jgi:hypothetical protein
LDFGSIVAMMNPGVQEEKANADAEDTEEEEDG